MAAYVDGDQAAFSQLFAATAPRLLSFFLRAVPDRALAEDLLQRTFERVHAARHRYQRGAPVRPWLFTIAAHVRVDELRRRYRLPGALDDADLDALPDSAAAHDEQPDQSDRDARVRAAIDALPASQRVVVHLHRFEGMTFGEIGAVLGAKEGAVRIRAFRAYETLRNALAPLMEGER
ncbi:MAG TPA: sigma-70 family RNA polymerase sigma factor [Polyangiales bacterium]|nr:sigma-70 family RNA polymerase sigma factor [Polyangiales bacterium]